jgi:predicted ArsR family transcriptional regulator
VKNIHDLILELIQKNQTASAAELSVSLQVTRADIRYHLKQLLENHKIEPAATLKSSGKGRPTVIFRLSSKAQLNNYLQIADLLLSTTSHAEEKNETAEILAASMAKAVPNTMQRTRQLNQLISFLDDHGYRAGWEAFPDGPRILFRNCPYSGLIKNHPELCKMDQILLEKVLGIHFDQLQKIDPDSVKIPACVFKISKQQNET